MAATSQPDSTMDSIRDGRRDTEHGARSTFKHSASDRGSVSLAHTYPHEARQKLLVPHTRTQSLEPGETVNPLPEYTYTPSHTECHARRGASLSASLLGPQAVCHRVWTPSRLRVPAGPGLVFAPCTASGKTSFVCLSTANESQTGIHRQGDGAVCVSGLPSRAVRLSSFVHTHTHTYMHTL